MTTRLSDYTNPDMRTSATRRAAVDYRLPDGRQRGDGTLEGVAQTAFERGAMFGHAFPRIADAELAQVWGVIDEALVGEKDGTNILVPVEDLRTLQAAMRAAFVRPGYDLEAVLRRQRERAEFQGLLLAEGDEES